MKVFRLAIWAIFTLALLLIFASLAGQNQDLVNVTLFRHTTQDYPKWAVLIASFFLGAALSSCFFIVQLIIVETKNIRLRRAARRLERALEALKGSATSGSGTGPASSIPLIDRSLLEEDV